MFRMVPFGDFHICFRPNSFARLVGRDGRALHADAMLADGVGRVDGDLIAGRVAMLDPEIEVLEIDIEVRKDETLADHLPDDAGHLVAVELDDGLRDLDLLHAADCPGTRGPAPWGRDHA